MAGYNAEFERGARKAAIEEFHRVDRERYATDAEYRKRRDKEEAEYEAAFRTSLEKSETMK